MLRAPDIHQNLDPVTESLSHSVNVVHSNGSQLVVFLLRPSSPMMLLLSIFAELPQVGDVLTGPCEDRISLQEFD